MATPIATPLAAILTAVKAQVLLQVPALTTNRILLVTDSQTPKYQGDQDLLIRPGKLQVVESLDSGSGRYAPVVERALVFTLRSRFNVDLSDRADSWITDPTYGYYLYEEALVAALHDWQPSDGVGNVLTQEPIHWISSTGPQADKKNPGWGEADLIFSLKYQVTMKPTGSGL